MLSVAAWLLTLTPGYNFSVETTPPIGDVRMTKATTKYSYSCVPRSRNSLQCLLFSAISSLFGFVDGERFHCSIAVKVNVAHCYYTAWSIIDFGHQPTPTLCPLGDGDRRSTTHTKKRQLRCQNACGLVPHDSSGQKPLSNTS
jgi:hypothetical protein